MRSMRTFATRVAIMAVVMAALLQVVAPAAAAKPRTEYDMIYATIHSKMGDQWKHRATGPDKFDCSGLVWFGFHENSLQDRIGGYRSVAGYFSWFKERSLVSQTDPQVGDLVVWGHNQHIGLYVGGGMAISTLVTKHGVSLHPVKGYLGMRFKAYLHTQLTRP